MGVPREVPLGPRVFVNRQSDFEWMTGFWSAAGPEGARVGVCSGLPGVGKRAFLRRCVEQTRAAHQFTDGDLHVDFGSVHGERMSVADALSSCLSGLGVAADVMPATLPQRMNRLRSLTAEKSVLIVLENVTDAAQVLPFVPNGARSAVLVTSSSRLSELVLDGADSRLLEPLDGDAGAHLITDLVGERARQSPVAVAELVRLCAGLPVALKVAAAKLVARPGLRVESLVTEIDAELDLASFRVAGRETVSAVFSAACAGLDAESARLYRLLGLVPGDDVTIDAAAALAGTEVRLAVGTLIEAGLLLEDSGQRLSLHPLQRKHAIELSQRLDSEQERADALRRLIRHLVVRAAFADRAALGEKRFRCTPDSVTAGHEQPFAGDSARRAALGWMDSERMNLLAAQRAAAEAGWHEWSWQLAESLSALYVIKRYYIDWTVSSEIGAESARLAGDRRAEARLRSFVSRAWMEREAPQRAHDELIIHALPLAEAEGDDRLLASVWEFIGRYREAVEPNRAHAAYARSLEAFRRVDDVRGQAIVLVFLARTQRSEGDLGRAEHSVRTGLALIREVGEPRMEGRALIELGRVLVGRDFALEARGVLTEAIGLLTGSGDAFYEAEAHEELVSLAEREQDLDVMRSSLSRMVHIHTQLGSGRAGQLIERLNQLPDQP